MIGEVGADVMIKPPDFKVGHERAPQSFTPLPEFQKPTMTEPPRFQEPTPTPEMDQLMAEILSQGKPENPQAVIKQVEKRLPQEAKKSQGFFEKIIDWLRNLFR